MYYTGIDLHKQTSYLTTVDSKGVIVKQKNLKNNPFEILNYFHQLKGEHSSTVETTGGWYWLSDLLKENNIPLKLAHAKYVKAIAYAKVKTDKVDSHILAQLLRMDFIPEANKIDEDLRPLRDTLRARLRLTQKRTSALNFMNRMLEKFNITSPSELSEEYQLQYNQFLAQADFLKEQMLVLEKSLYPKLIPDNNIQLLLGIPGIGKMNAFTAYLEIYDIHRFDSVKNFLSYCRLAPKASNSGGKTKQSKTPKDGNKYLKIVFSDAAIHAIQHYPVIKKHYNSLLRKKNKQIAKYIISKEIASIVYRVLKTEKAFNNKFKNKDLQHIKSFGWPRITSPDV